MKLSSGARSRSKISVVPLPTLRAADHHHQHEVDAVAVHALGRRPAQRIGARLDAELVHLDVRRAPRREAAEQREAEASTDCSVGAARTPSSIGAKWRAMPPFSRL